MAHMFNTHLDNRNEMFNILKHNQMNRLNVLWYESVC